MMIIPILSLIESAICSRIPTKNDDNPHIAPYKEYIYIYTYIYIYMYVLFGGVSSANGGNLLFRDVRACGIAETFFHFKVHVSSDKFYLTSIVQPSVALNPEP